MNIKEAVAYLEGLQRFPRQPGLRRVRTILAQMGNPEKGMNAVHVTGTNGKGSTSAMLASVVQTAGYKVGLLTSPHLHCYNERIKINGRDISDSEFVFYVEKIKKSLDRLKVHLTTFEVLTVLAFLYFFDQKVDLAVLEVGIGGRYDATNVIKKSIAVITNVDLEHQAVLGNTKAKIAVQKAGIIKKNSQVIIGEQNKNLQKIFEREARKKNAGLVFLKPRNFRRLKQSEEGQVFNFKDYKKIEIPLLGRHQLHNASLAILAVESLQKNGYKVGKDSLYKGLRNVYWPLRLEKVHSHPTIILDAGHNLHGIAAVIKTIDEIFPRRGRILVLGCSTDKPYVKMAKKLASLSKKIILTRARYHGVDPKILAEAIRGPRKKIQVEAHVKKAIDLAKKLAGRNGRIFVLGGLYLAAEAEKELVR